MKRRKRLIASVFTTLAMTFSLGEAVLASTCSPDMDGAMRGAAESTSPHGMPCCEPAQPRDAINPPAEDVPQDMDCLFGALHRHTGPEHEGGDEAPCPFGPAAGVVGCATAASLPAHTFGDLALSPESAMTVVVDDTQHSPSFATALFHPPKP